jgi:CubicO group peptidase (beta-lactamase class C family)
MGTRALSLVAAVDSVLSGFSPEAPGVVVMARLGDVTASRAVGLAVSDPAVPLGPDSVCYVGSVAKQFTAACVAAARDSGCVSFEDPVSRWLPELPSWAATMTVDDLLGHRSGLADYFTVEGLRGRQVDGDFDDAALVRLLQTFGEIGFDPGSRFEYSNTNYVLLTIIVARATGVPFPAFARTSLFEPLGMMDSRFLAGTSPPFPAARAYREADGEWIVDDPVLGVVGDGGMRTTARDLLTWLDALHHGGVTDSMRDVLMEEGALSSSLSTGYARGLMHRTHAGRAVVCHGGGLGGWRAEALHVPNADLSVAVVANRADADAPRIALQVVDAALGDSSATGPSSMPLPMPLPVELIGVWTDDLDFDALEFAETADGAEIRGALGAQPVIGTPGGARMVTADVDWRLFASEGETVLEHRVRGRHQSIYERARAAVDDDPSRYLGTYVSDVLGQVVTVTSDGAGIALFEEGEPFAVMGRPVGRLVPTGLGAFIGNIGVRFDSGNPAPSMRLSVARARNLVFARTAPPVPSTD